MVGVGSRGSGSRMKSGGGGKLGRVPAKAPQRYMWQHAQGGGISGLRAGCMPPRRAMPKANPYECIKRRCSHERSGGDKGFVVSILKMERECPGR